MTTQLAIPFATHTRENNALSESHLEQHKAKFSGDCLEILKRLVRGEKLTVKGAMIEGLSGHLPRRVADIREMGIPISDIWIGTGRSKVKEYFMTPEDKLKALESLVDKSKMAA